MAKRIAPQFIETLKDRADIVSVINARVPLKKAGKDYQACCPFHNEKTPSFTVSAQKQFYYCFGCGAKGNVLKFLMDFEHLSFVDAVEKLADESGMTVEYEQLSKSTVAKIERQKTLQEVLTDTAKLYEKNLYHPTLGAAARQYFSERQLDKETTAFFALGYSQSGHHLQKHFGQEVAPDTLHKAGLLGQGNNGYYDFFRDRLMFPIRDARGRVVGFGARALGDAKPKYLNTGDTELFNKSHVLYGLYEELQTNRNIEHLIVVEGYMDVIALHQMGVQGAVAALGTAFTQGHLNLVRKYTKNIFICFDGDNAGKKAAKRAMELILPEMTVDTKIKLVFLPDGEDPDSLVRKIGKTAFVEILETGQYFSQFVCESIIGDGDLAHFEERGEMAARAKLLFDVIPEGKFKHALEKELTHYADGFVLYGEDSNEEHLVADTQIRQQTFSTPRTAVAVANKTRESRLIRYLLALPELVVYVRHEGLLNDNESSDRELLYRLIQYLQLNPVPDTHDDEVLLQQLLLAFDERLGQRLLHIARNEKFAELPNERLEQRKQRLQQECLARLDKLLSEIQQKLARWA